jgi:hypothetical protein
MMRLTTLIWLALASLAGVGLFQVKYRVQSLEQDLGQINRQILRDQEAVHVLGAEWSLLNEPARIADMSRRHLELTPFTAAQLAHFSDLPDRIVPHPATPGDSTTVVPATAPLVALGVPMAALPAAPAPTPAPVSMAAQPVSPAPAIPIAARPAAQRPSVAALPEHDPDVEAVLASMRSSQ